MYPNPADDNIIVQTEYPIENTTINLYNVSGVVIKKEIAAFAGNQAEININYLPAGSYFIRIQNGERVFYEIIQINHYQTH